MDPGQATTTNWMHISDLQAYLVIFRHSYIVGPQHPLPFKKCLNQPVKGAVRWPQLKFLRLQHNKFGNILVEQKRLQWIWIRYNQVSLRLEGVSIFHEDVFVIDIPLVFIESFILLVTSWSKPGAMVTKTLLNVFPGDNSMECTFSSRIIANL